MGRSSHKHSGTKHTGTAFVHKRHHHENKRDVADKRAIEQVRRGNVAVCESPLPELKPLLSSDQISAIIREVIGEGFDDTFQDVWVQVLEHGLNDVDKIKAVAREISKKNANQVISDKYRTIDLDTPIGRHKDESDDFTLESVIPSPPERTEEEIEQDINADAPRYKGFGKQSRKGVVWLDDDAMSAIRARFPHEALLVAIKHLLGVPINEQTPYSLWEDAMVRERYPWGGSQAVQLSVNRSLASINQRARVLGVRLDGKQRPVKEWLTIPDLATELGVTPYKASTLIRAKAIASVRIPGYYENRDGVFVTPRALADYRAGIPTPEVHARQQLAEALKCAKTEVRTEMQEKMRVALGRSRKRSAEVVKHCKSYKARLLRNSRAELAKLVEERRSAIEDMKAEKKAELAKLVEERRSMTHRVLAEYTQSRQNDLESYKRKKQAELDHFIAQYQERLAEWRQNDTDRKALERWSAQLKEERTLVTHIAESWQLKRWNEIRHSVADLEAGKWLVVQLDTKKHLCYEKDGFLVRACHPTHWMPADVFLTHKYDPFTWGPPTCKVCLQVLEKHGQNDRSKTMPEKEAFPVGA